MPDKPNNPPAFPRTSEQGLFEETQKGMTLRDYFAGQALSGIMAFGRYSKHDGEIPLDKNQKAEYAYEIADEMLHQREEGK